MKRAALLIHGPLSVVGGVERYNRYLLDFLKEESFNVDVFEPSTVNVPIFVRRYLYPFTQYYYVGREIARNIAHYDLIITTGYTGGFLKGSNIINISFGSVQSYHNAIKDARLYNRNLLIGTRLATLFDRLSKKGKRCIAISPQVKRELERDYGVRSAVVPCGIDINHFSRRESGRELRRRYGIDPQTMVGVFAGRWDSAHKGLDMLIPIMRERNDVHWLIAPEGAIDPKGIKNLTILLNVSYEELPTVYSAADFSIQLSRYESFGFSFIESLSCSVPVISTPVGIAAQLYDDPVLGQLLVPYQKHSHKAMMQDVHGKIEKLKDRQYREELSGKSRAKIEREFSLEAWKERMREALWPAARGSA